MLFFAPEGVERKRARLRREAAAKALCGSCELQPVCLATALERNEPHGIWGGATETERRALRVRAIAR